MVPEALKLNLAPGALLERLHAGSEIISWVVGGSHIDRGPV